MKLGERITVVTQNVQEGFGHAVYCAKDWVNSEPFLLLLGYLVRGRCFDIGTPEAYRQTMMDFRNT